MVDTRPPDTTITGGPSGGTNDPTPTFSFASSEPGSRFQCNSETPFSTCSSPLTTQHLADGLHYFRVRDIDAAGNTDPTPATRSFTVSTAYVRISGSTLVATAASGARDNLEITRPSASTLRIADLPKGTHTGSGVRTGAGCTPSGDYTANCASVGITLIQVLAADQPDRVLNATGVKSSLDGGGADDNLKGGANDDTLTGAGGIDVMLGKGGNDVLMARDLTSDSRIDCDGDGAAPGRADRAVLDLLPRDPINLVTNCEMQERRP
jgi:Ca2+-binding RTX toxin-like protein